MKAKSKKGKCQSCGKVKNVQYVTIKIDNRVLPPKVICNTCTGKIVDVFNKPN